MHYILFDFIFNLIAIIQCILTLINLRIDDKSLKYYIGIILFIIDYIWIIEILIRLIGTHWRKYIHSRHLLNGIITIIVIIINLLSRIKCGFNKMDDSIELLRLFVVFIFCIKIFNIFIKIIFNNINSFNICNVFICNDWNGFIW